MRVGVLALQGDVPEHVRALETLLPPGSVRPVRRPADLEGIVALFMPGGESTTIGRLLHQTGLGPRIREQVLAGFPVLATCAGLILLARQLEPSPRGRDPTPLGVLDVLVRRNDYGSQRESFEGPVSVDGLARPFPGVFIRAPRIVSVGAGATGFAEAGGEVVGVRHGNVWGLTFHPELSGDPRLHAMFLSETLGFGQTTRKIRASRTPAKKAAPTATAIQ